MGNRDVITKVDIGSNHRIVRARVEANKKLVRLMKIQNQNPLKSDLTVVEKLSTPSE